VLFKKKNSPKQKTDTKNTNISKPENANDSFFVLTGLGNGSAWSLDNSRIKDFSFEKLYNNCSL
jgi:hypothetical protein